MLSVGVPMIRQIYACVLATVLAGACAPATTAMVPQEPPTVVVQEVAGPVYVTLLGNYAGKQIRLEVDGQVLVERRMMFPPPGAEDRFLIPLGPARSVPVRLDIAGCPAPWTGEFQVQQGQNHVLIFDGCDIRAGRGD